MPQRRIRAGERAEFGDYQTPPELALRICSLLQTEGMRPAAVVEPTCGTGNLLLAALSAFPSARRFVGLDIDAAHLARLRCALGHRALRRTQILQGDFYKTDWPALLDSLPEPILILGNPPWVTNAALGALQSRNLPIKTNVRRDRGLDALTGKANFDISEWMLTHLLECLQGRSAVLAMLCKTTVARRVLRYLWNQRARLGDCRIFGIDAAEHFSASVDACLFRCSIARSAPETRECRVFDSLRAAEPSATIGYREGRLLADAPAFDGLKDLHGPDALRWRSGVKHDAVAVMELTPGSGGRYRNGLGETPALEDELLYPMLKSSELGRGVSQPGRWMLVPQKRLGEDTGGIACRAPLTWKYLVRHGALLDARKSSIYRNRPRFSVFGVGEYSFSPWKVAVSAFSKEPAFRVIGPWRGKPVVLDDTACFLPCGTEEEACSLASLLNSDVAGRFYSAFLFRDMKRPVTIDLLERLNIPALARRMGRRVPLPALAHEAVHP